MAPAHKPGIMYENEMTLIAAKRSFKLSDTAPRASSVIAVFIVED